MYRLLQSAVHSVSSQSASPLHNALSLLVLAGSSLAKIPQLKRAVRLKNAAAIHPMAILLETISNSIALAYHWRLRSFSIAVFGENACLLVQNLLLLTVSLVLRKRFLLLSVFSFVYGVFHSSLFMQRTMDEQTLLWLEKDFTLPIILMAKATTIVILRKSAAAREGFSRCTATHLMIGAAVRSVLRLTEAGYPRSLGYLLLFVFNLATLIASSNRG